MACRALVPGDDARAPRGRADGIGDGVFAQISPEVGCQFKFERVRRAAAIDSHIKNMGVLAERLHRDGVRLIFMSPSPYDQTGNQKEENRCGVNDALKACGAAAHRLAETVQAGWVDFNAPMDAINRAWQAKQPDFTLVGPDRIHPGPVGHLVMAGQSEEAGSMRGLLFAGQANGPAALMIQPFLWILLDSRQGRKATGPWVWQ